MQIKLVVKKITQNEDGTVATKLEPVLVGAPVGAYVSGEIFTVVQSQIDQPAELVYNAELNSDLGAFLEMVEEPEEPMV